MLFTTPTTCFGEDIKSGCLRLAEFCLIKSVGLLIIFAVDLVSVYEHNHFVHTLIPAALVLFSILKIVCNVYLYKGAKYGIASYMKPWFWVYSIQTGVLAVLGMGGSIFLAFAFWNQSEMSASSFVIMLIYCTASKYFCQVVRALMIETERGASCNDTVRPTPFTNQEV